MTTHKQVDDIARGAADRARLRAGTARVRAAMQHVEAAQRELSRAIQDLAAVVGYAPDSDRLRKLFHKVKDEWYRLEKRVQHGETMPRRPFQLLDRTPTELDDDPHAQGCGQRGYEVLE